MLATLVLMAWLIILTFFISMFGNEILEINRGLNKLQKELDEVRDLVNSWQGE